MKDAASTAIYGSKASNGVVVVETIRPKSGKLNLAYNGNANVSWADLSSYNLMDASEKLRFENLVGRYDASNDVVKDVELKKSYYDKLADIARGVNTYWLSEPLRVGLNHRHSLYVDGGEGAFMFGIGLAYNGITGVMKESKRDNISGNIDLTYRLKKFQFMNKFDMNNTDSKDPIVAFPNMPTLILIIRNTMRTAKWKGGWNIRIILKLPIRFTMLSRTVITRETICRGRISLL